MTGLLKDSAPGNRHGPASPTPKLLKGQFIRFIDHHAQRIALPEIARIPTIAKEARLETFAFSRQVVEFWMSCVRLAKLLADLQHGQALFLQFSVETSGDLRRFNALANPRFIISLFTPGGDMSFAPGREA